MDTGRPWYGASSQNHLCPWLRTCGEVQSGRNFAWVCNIAVWSNPRIPISWVNDVWNINIIKMNRFTQLSKLQSSTKRFPIPFGLLRTYIWVQLCSKCIIIEKIYILIHENISKFVDIQEEMHEKENEISLGCCCKLRGNNRIVAWCYIKEWLCK